MEPLTTYSVPSISTLLKGWCTRRDLQPPQRILQSLEEATEELQRLLEQQHRPMARHLAGALAESFANQHLTGALLWLLQHFHEEEEVALIIDVHELCHQLATTVWLRVRGPPEKVKMEPNAESQSRWSQKQKSQTMTVLQRSNE